MSTLLTILYAVDRRAAKSEEFAMALCFVLAVVIMMVLAFMGTATFIVCYHMLRWAAIVP